MALLNAKKSAFLRIFDISAVSSEKAAGISSQSEKSMVLVLVELAVTIDNWSGQSEHNS